MKNDFFYNIIANPEFTNTDFKSVGVNASNSTIKDKDFYLSNSAVVEEFTDKDGKFDNVKFENAYYYALSKFNELANDTYLEDAEQSVQYSFDNMFAPIEKRASKQSPIFSNTGNPIRPDEQYGYRQYTQGIEGITKTAKTDKSIQEIAQTQKVYDPETNTWEDAPNDSFFANMLDTRVLAQWDFNADENGNPTEDENKIAHYKGEIKLNEEGLPYYENLNGRSIAGREVLHLSDVLTTDGSAMDSINFFDSDDLNKSVTGTIMKTAVTIAPMLIAPIAPYYIGLGVAYEVAKLSTQAVQLGTSLLFGESPELANSIEGYLTSYELSPSKSYSKSQWNWTNIINLIGDVFKQLAEQRWIATQGASWVRKVFQGKNQEELVAAESAKVLEEYTKQAKKFAEQFTTTQDLNALKKYQQLIQMGSIEARNAGQRAALAYNKFNSNLATIYMTGVTAADSFNQAKVDGLSDREAALYTIGYSAAEFALLKTDIGQWVLPEAKFDKYKLKTIIEKAAPNIKMDKTIREKLVNTAIKDHKARALIEKGFKSAIIKHKVGKGLANYAFGNALAEGVEETTEELLVDVSKSIFNAGLSLAGGDNRLTAWDNVFDRYSMSFVGGTIGGGLFSMTKDLRNAYSALQDMQRTTAQQEIVSYLREGKKDQLIKEISKTKFNTDALALDFETSGDKVFLKAGSSTNNLNKDIQNAMINYIETLDGVLKQNGLDISRETIIDNYIPDLRYSALIGSSQLGLYVQDFENAINSAVANAITYNTSTTTAARQANSIEDENITKKALEEDKKGTTGEVENVELKSYKKILQDAKQSFEESLQIVEDFKSGKNRRDYILSAIMDTNPSLQFGFISPTFRDWVQIKTGKDYSEITEDEYTKYKKKYDDYISKGAYRQDMFRAAQTLRNLVEKTADNVKNWKESLGKGASYVSDIDNKIFELIREKKGEESIDTDTLAAIVLHQVAAEIDQKGAEQVALQIKNEGKNLTLKEFITAYLPVLTKDIDKLTAVFKSIKKYNMPTEKLLNTIEELVKWSSEDETLNILLDDNANQNTKDFIRNLNELDDGYGGSIITSGNLEDIKVSSLLKGICTTLGVKEDVSQTLQTLLKSQRANPEQFATDTNILDEMILLVQQVRTMLEAYRNQASLNVLYGYTGVRNELFTELDGLTELDEITINDAQKQLDMLIDNIKKFKILTELNMGKKLNRQTACGTRILKLLTDKYKKLVEWIEEDINKDSNFLSSAEKEEFEKFKEIISSLEDSESIAKMSQLEQEKRRDILFTAVHNFFSNTKIMDSPERGAILFNSDRIVYLNACNSTLNEFSNDIDYRSFYWLTSAITAINPHDFFHKYKDIITDDIAPIPLQEYATYIGYAALKNKEVFSKFRNVFIHILETQRKDESPYSGLKKDVEGLYSQEHIDSGVYPRWLVAMIEGVAGAGKSTAIIGNIVKLEGTDSELFKKTIVVSSSVENAKKLAQDAGIPEENCEFHVIKTLLQKVSPDYLSKVQTNNNGIQTTDQANLTNVDTLPKIACDTTIENGPTMILIDEVSLASCTDVDTIYDYCNANNVELLLAGDLAQTSILGKIVLQKTQEELEEEERTKQKKPNNVVLLNMFRGYTIGGFASELSMRPDNDLLEQASTIFRRLVGTTFNGKTVIQTPYFKNETDFRGVAHFDDNDKVANEQEVIKIMVDKCRKANEQLKDGEAKHYIAYIHDQETDAVFEDLKTKYGDVIKEFNGVSFSGITADYSIINLQKAVEFNIVYDFMDSQGKQRLVYTAITRSRQGALILNTPYPMEVQSTLKTSFIDTGYNKQAIANYSKQRKAIYDEVYKDGSEIASSQKPRKKPTPQSNDTSQEQEGDNNNELNNPQEFLGKTIDTDDKVFLWSFNREYFPDINTQFIKHNKFGFNGFVLLKHKEEINGKGGDHIPPTIGQLFSSTEYAGYSPEEVYSQHKKLYRTLFSYVLKNDTEQIKKVLSDYASKNLSEVKVGVGIKIYSGEDSKINSKFKRFSTKQSPNIIVAILYITDAEGNQDTLEIPLGSINNFATYIYEYIKSNQDEGKLKEALKDYSGEYLSKAREVRAIVKGLIAQYPDNQFYKNIKLLADIWIYGANRFMPISDVKVGNPGFEEDYFEKSAEFLKEMNKTRQGPLMITKDITSVELASLNSKSSPETLARLKADEELVTSDVLVTKNDVMNGPSEILIRKGIPFILVSDNLSYNEDDLYKLFMENSENRKEISIYYVDNPKVTPEQYISYIFTALRNKGSFNYNIGDSLTNIKITYELLKILKKYYDLSVQEGEDNDVSTLTKIIYGGSANPKFEELTEIENFLSEYYDLETFKKKDKNVSFHDMANKADEGGELSIHKVANDFVLKVLQGIMRAAQSAENEGENTIKNDLIKALNDNWFRNGIYVSLNLEKTGTVQEVMKAKHQGNKVEVLGEYQDLQVGGKVISSALGMPIGFIEKALNQVSCYKQDTPGDTKEDQNKDKVVGNWYLGIKKKEDNTEAKEFYNKLCQMEYNLYFYKIQDTVEPLYRSVKMKLSDYFWITTEKTKEDVINALTEVGFIITDNALFKFIISEQEHINNTRYEAGEYKGKKGLYIIGDNTKYLFLSEDFSELIDLRAEPEINPEPEPNVEPEQKNPILTSIKQKIGEANDSGSLTVDLTTEEANFLKLGDENEYSINDVLEQIENIEVKILLNESLDKIKDFISILSTNEKLTLKDLNELYSPIKEIFEIKNPYASIDVIFEDIVNGDETTKNLFIEDLQELIKGADDSYCLT